MCSPHSPAVSPVSSGTLLLTVALKWVACGIFRATLRLAFLQHSSAHSFLYVGLGSGIGEAKATSNKKSLKTSASDLLHLASFPQDSPTL